MLCQTVWHGCLSTVRHTYSTVSARHGTVHTVILAYRAKPYHVRTVLDCPCERSINQVLKCKTLGFVIKLKQSHTYKTHRFIHDGNTSCAFQVCDGLSFVTKCKANCTYHTMLITSCECALLCADLSKPVNICCNAQNLNMCVFWVWPSGAEL